MVYTSRLFGGRRGNKVRYCCSTRDRRLPACWEANPGAGVCNTEVIMAVNLDKEAYYRRIKRLYSNWKVNFCRIAQCVWTCTHTSAVESRKFEGREAEAKLAAVSIQRVVGFCCRREKRWCSTNPPLQCVEAGDGPSSAIRPVSQLGHIYTLYCSRNVSPVRFYPPEVSGNANAC